LITVLGTLATCSIIFLFHILARLSEKFGSVLRMPAYYKWYYLAEVLTGVATLAHLMQASTYLAQSAASPVEPGTLFKPTSLAFTLTFYHLPLVIAVTIGLFITWRYWGWLITDRNK
jgi:hypothetical protein